MICLTGDHGPAGTQKEGRLGYVPGLAGALNGVRSIEVTLGSSGQSLFHGLSTKPGATALTRISGAKARAKLRVRLIRPALLGDTSAEPITLPDPTKKPPRPRKLDEDCLQHPNAR
jgi:hypothetical protein